MTATRTENEPDADIRAVVESMFSSFAAGDVTGVEQLLADDCTVWDVFTPALVVGADQRHAFHQADRAQSQARGAFSWAIRFVRVEHWDTVAIACYYLDFSYAEPGAMTGTVRTTDVLRRHRGGWQIVHHHEGLSPGPLD